MPTVPGTHATPDRDTVIDPSPPAPDEGHGPSGQGPRIRCGALEVELVRDTAALLGSDPRCALAPTPAPRGLAARHLRFAWVGARIRAEALPGATMTVHGEPVRVAMLDPGDTVLAADPDGSPLLAVLALPPVATGYLGSLNPSHAGTPAGEPGSAKEPEALSPGEAAAWMDAMQVAGDNPEGDAAPSPANGPTGRWLATIQANTGRARSLRAGPQTEFQQLMAEELRRTPWFSISLLLHAIALLLLLWLVPREVVPPPLPAAVYTMRPGDPIPPDELSQDDEVPLEVQDAPEPPMPEDTELPVPDDEPPPMREPELRPEPGLDASAWTTPLTGTRRGDPLKGRNGVGLSSGFRDRVARLREGGFELIFVFDTTQSMVRALAETKAQLAHQLEVVQALVPGSRIGLVTYRDRGPREDYVTRSIPLDEDPYRALNFISVAAAKGGGDLPEAVFDGLKVAIEQQWAPETSRVVVLVGDAPPHEEDMGRIRELVTRFSSNANSRLHTVVTIGNRRDAPDPATRETFGKIARWGRGEAMVQSQGSGPLLARLLSLAFGRDFAKDLAQVDQMVAATRQPAGHVVRTLASGADPDKLQAALKQKPLDPALLKEIARQGRPEAARALVELVGRRALSAHTRHAAAWCLQQMLDLEGPPTDPVTEEPASNQELRELRGAIRERLERG